MQIAFYSYFFSFSGQELIPKMEYSGQLFISAVNIRTIPSKPIYL